MSGPGMARPAPSFRRRPFEARRRRSHPLMRALRPALRLLLLLAAPGAIGSWLLTSEAFRLRSIDVEGAVRVDAAWIQARLGNDVGRNLFRLRLSAVSERLAEHSWIRAVEVHKQLPDRLMVRLYEHRPVALLEREDGYSYLSEGGEPITPRVASEELNRFLIVGFAESLGKMRDGGLVAGTVPSGAAPAVSHLRGELRRALEVAREFDTLNASWTSGLLRIEILGGEEYRVRLATLPFPVLVRAGTLAGKAEDLEQLLPQVLERWGRIDAVDLRFSRRIVVQPTLVSAALATG